MKGYVDGFVVPVRKRDLPAYRKLATKVRRAWMKAGALQFIECLAEDLGVHPGCGPGFAKGLRLRRGETLAFALIVFKSRAHRDAVNRRAGEATSTLPNAPKRMPLEVNRMLYGGFEVIERGGAFPRLGAR